MCKDNFIDTANMTDEQVDRLFAEKKTNSLKSLAPLFVYLILQEHSDKHRHLTHRQIRDYLAEYPYEIDLERKALGRCIHLLTAIDRGIYSDPRYGTWLE